MESSLNSLALVMVNIVGLAIQKVCILSEINYHNQISIVLKTEPVIDPVKAQDHWVIS